MALNASQSDSDVSPQFLVPVPILTAIALGLVGLRIRTRLARTRKLKLDDWLIIIGTVWLSWRRLRSVVTKTSKVLSLVNFIFASVAFAYGWGHPFAKVAPSDFSTSRKAQFGYATVWMATLCFVRLSIAASLFRFGQEKLWRGTLYAIMTLQTLISMSFIIMQFVQCTPVASFWQNVPGVKCWPLKPMLIYGWIIAGVCVGF